MSVLTKQRVDFIRTAFHSVNGSVECDLIDTIDAKDRRIEELEDAVADLNSFDAPKELFDARTRIAELELSVKSLSGSTLAYELRIRELRKTLVEAVIPLEVIGGQMNVGHDFGFCTELKEQVLASIAAVRAEIMNRRDE